MYAFCDVKIHRVLHMRLCHPFERFIQMHQQLDW